MNLPNKLTVLRVILIPFFVAFMLINAIPANLWLALLVFAVASITDWFDGRIARKHNLITNFGKFLDPLADKLLVMSALVCFCYLKWCDPVCVIIILAREFMVSGLRLVTATSGIVVAAGMSGKLKTAFTMIAIVVMIIMGGIGHVNFVVNEILMWIATILTVVSGMTYVNAYKDYINPNE